MEVKEPMQAKEANTDAVAEVKDWLSDNWDPDLSVGEWWERLGTSGWAAPGLPAAYPL